MRERLGCDALTGAACPARHSRSRRPATPSRRRGDPGGAERGRGRARRSRPPSRPAARRAPTARSWSPRPVASGSTSATRRPTPTSAPNPEATEAYERFEKINRELLDAVHRLADGARGGRRTGPQRPLRRRLRRRRSSTGSAPSTNAPRRCSTASPRSSRGSGSTRRRLDEAYDKVARRRARLGLRRPHRQLPHGLVRAARGPPADARARTRGGALTAVADRVVVLDGATVPTARWSATRAASIAWMLSLGLPVPPALVPADRGVPPLPRRRRRARRRGLGLGARRDRRARGTARPQLRRRRAPAARLGPLGRRGLDAGDDGHDPQPRHHRRGRGGAGAPLRRRRLRPLDPLPLRPPVRRRRCSAPTSTSPARTRPRRRSARRSARDTGEEVPTDPHEQLRAVIKTVFGSWSSRRAKAYRKHWGISEDGGTAVIVQAMVFGNLGEDSGTGVLFSRNPLSGDPEPYGEWLPRGQGEDVVSGTHDPLPLTALAERDARRPRAPARRGEAARARARRRPGHRVHGRARRALPAADARREALAAGRACGPPSTSSSEGAIDRAEALQRVSAEQLATRAGAARLRARRPPPPRSSRAGIAACPGVAGGVAVGDSDAACEARGRRRPHPPDDQPRGRQRDDRRARRGHRARRLDLARGGRHPRARPAQRGRRRRGRDGGAGRRAS